VAGDRDASDVVVKEPRLSAATSVGTRIDIVSDTICPWCYIGKRHLEHALATLAEEGLTFQVHWNPFQLNLTESNYLARFLSNHDAASRR
jgi:predicted DsbA family dithiol-disulfide isomerase